MKGVPLGVVAVGAGGQGQQTVVFAEGDILLGCRRVVPDFFRKVEEVVKARKAGLEIVVVVTGFIEREGFVNVNAVVGVDIDVNPVHVLILGKLFGFRNFFKLFHGFCVHMLPP